MPPSSGPAPTPTAPTPPAPTSRRFTRDDIVRLGQSGRPWDFLPLVEGALRIAPSDAGLILLAAANAAKLGLRTLALEKLATIPPTLRADPAVTGLAAAIDALPDDRLPAPVRAATCRANIGALCERLPSGQGEALLAPLAAWEAHATDHEWFRASDGNIVRRAAGTWTRFTDDVARCRAVSIPAGEDPITIEGADPPWLLRRVLAESTRRNDGFWRRVRLVEPDLAALCDALACADLRAELSQPRLDLFLGPTAAAALDASLRANLHTRITGPILLNPALQNPPTAPPTLSAAASAQVSRLETLRAEVAALYSARDAAWWSRRYDEAAADPEKPLRVLIPTHRFSTFIRHSAADLAAAFTRLSCRAELLMEPDDSSRLATTAYFGALARLQPDLVVLINYTRHNLAGAIPPGVPVVCWIQDALSHLFTEETGRAQGDLDFLLGHLPPDLTRLFAYPPRSRGRSLPVPVVVNEEKFHPGPVDPALAERLTCEIAFASNQSETPEACRDRLVAESAASPVSVRAIRALYERTREVCADTMSGRVGVRLETAAREEITRAGAPDDPRTVTHALNQWCRPIADRILRHEAARWAAELAREHGWRFHLYGRGWESHPTLHPHARGVLDHGEELRASYQCAAVHLHASVNWSLHQRIMECALSGGLPLCRLKRDDLSPIESHVIRTLIETAQPCMTWLPTRALLYATADSPEAMAASALLQRLGLPAPRFWAVQPEWAADPSTYDGGLPMTRDTAWLTGDPAETTFATKADLASAVHRALTIPTWRTATSAAISTRVRTHYTYKATATNTLTLLCAAFQRPSPKREP